MNISILRPLVGLLVLATYFTSCNLSHKSGKDNQVQLDSTVVEQTCHLLNDTANPNCDLQIRFIYPVAIAHQDLLPMVQKQFVTAYFGEEYEALSPREAVEQYKKDYLSAYKELEADYQEELKQSKKGTPVGSWFYYYEMSSNQIQYNANNLICFTVNFENYTGGAHGAHAYNHYVINLSDGRRLTEEDLFIDEYQEPLAQLLVDQIAKQNQVNDPKKLEEMGYFSVEEIYPNNNFYVDDDGITYTFNEYEIAAYVVGPVHVHLTWDEVLHLLKPESSIRRIITN